MENEVIYGKNSVMEALISGKREINKILISKNIHTDVKINKIKELAQEKGIVFQFVGKDKFQLYEDFNHQGIIAQISPIEYMELEDFIENRGTNYRSLVILDGVEDVHNLGAIIRTCECAGVDGIVIPKLHACQVNETVIRTSTGAISNVKIARVTNLKEAIDTLKENGLWIYVCETGGEDIYKQNLTGPVGIVVGSEGFGVKQSIRTYCDGIITLPLKGTVNSLNASVASAITIYEILRQREAKK